MPDAATPPKIVVGVDGSPLAHAALEFAIDEARLRGASLQVTYAYPVIGSHITGSTGHDYYEQVEGEARALLQGLIAGAPSTEGIETEWLAVPGNPSEVLIEASKEAVLLVVGSRGVGGFLGLVMGSVSTQCVHYSHCPVLVVREEH
ncbi:MAG: universal stress protein [Acidimicrobiales bacterium]|jgi:nucleotide-binding universal stress UspA family protein